MTVKHAMTFSFSTKPDFWIRKTTWIFTQALLMILASTNISFRCLKALFMNNKNIKTQATFKTYQQSVHLIKVIRTVKT